MGDADNLRYGWVEAATRWRRSTRSEDMPDRLQTALGMPTDSATSTVGASTSYEAGDTGVNGCTRRPRGGMEMGTSSPSTEIRARLKAEDAITHGAATGEAVTHRSYCPTHCAVEHSVINGG